MREGDVPCSVMYTCIKILIYSPHNIGTKFRLLLILSWNPDKVEKLIEEIKIKNKYKQETRTKVAQVSACLQ